MKFITSPSIPTFLRLADNNEHSSVFEVGASGGVSKQEANDGDRALNLSNFRCNMEKGYPYPFSDRRGSR